MRNGVKKYIKIIYMHRKTNEKRRNNKTKTKKGITKKQKLGGKTYKHRKVGLFCNPSKVKELPIICNVCGENEYIERHTTLGKSKGNQALANLLIGDTMLEDLNNVTIISYFCFTCGMCKIIRGDKDYIYIREHTTEIP